MYLLFISHKCLHSIQASLDIYLFICFHLILSFVCLQLEEYIAVMADNPSLDPDVNFLNDYNHFRSSYLQECELSDFLKVSRNRTINLLHVNCRSLNKNCNDMLNLLQEISQKLSVIAISETWLNVDCF